MREEGNEGKYETSRVRRLHSLCDARCFRGVGVAFASATTWRVDDDLVQCPDANSASVQDAMDATSTSDDGCV